MSQHYHYHVTNVIVVLISYNPFLKYCYNLKFKNNIICGFKIEVGFCLFDYHVLEIKLVLETLYKLNNVSLKSTWISIDYLLTLE